MPIESDGPTDDVTEWIVLLNSASNEKRSEAEEKLWSHFKTLLLPQIRRRLQGKVRQRIGDSEVLQEVFIQFFNGTYEIKNRRSLAALLLTITIRTVINERNRHNRSSRDTARENPLSDVPSISIGHSATSEKRPYRRKNTQSDLSDASSDSFFSDATIELIRYGVSPEDAAVAGETFERLIGTLEGSPDLQVVLSMKLKGHSNTEIAEAFDTTETTIRRKIKLIKKRFLEIDASFEQTDAYEDDES